MRIRIVVTLLFITGNLILLHAQNVAELDRRNGFKSIKLGSSIDSVKGAVLKKAFLEKEEFLARLYETESAEYKNIGEVTVDKVQLMTYKNLIYKIVVTTEKDPRLMRALEKSFGKAVYVDGFTEGFFQRPHQTGVLFGGDDNFVDQVLVCHQLHFIDCHLADVFVFCAFGFIQPGKEFFLFQKGLLKNCPLDTINGAPQFNGFKTIPPVQFGHILRMQKNEIARKEKKSDDNPNAHGCIYLFWF